MSAQSGSRFEATGLHPSSPTISRIGNILIVQPREDENTEVLFDQVCVLFEHYKIEQDSEGNVYIMPPAGGESSYQNSELSTQLGIWAKQDGRGRAFDSSVEFILPDQSKRGPDASWVSLQKLKTLTREELRQFLQLVPDFVVELKSPSDQSSKLQIKMRDYQRNGVPLGWLIDPEKRKVFIYRHGVDEVEVFEGDRLLADGLVAGFELDLQPIWKGLSF
jgi:Uma2 family endonuclease